MQVPGREPELPLGLICYSKAYAYIKDMFALRGQDKLQNMQLL